MATQRHVAELARASVATVSRYINHKGFVSDELAGRIESAIQQLRYKPNLVARSLKLRSSRTIGLIFPDIENPFFIKVIKSVEEVAQENDYTVVLCNTKNDLRNEHKFLDILKGRLVDGYIVIPTLSDDANLAALLENENVVFLDRSIGQQGEICLRLDNIAGVRLAMEYFLELGHRRIGIVNVPVKVTTGLERFESYKQTLTAHQIAPDSKYIRFADFSPESSERETQTLLRQPAPPTAVIFASGPTTIGGLKAIRELGVKVPADLSVIGFDDFDTADLLDPPLTTVVQPAYEFGTRAAETIIRILQGRSVKPKVVILQPRLLKRGSCRGIDGGVSQRMDDGKSNCLCAENP